MHARPLDFLLKNFWELDDLGIKEERSSKVHDQTVQVQFERTIIAFSKGRNQVALHRKGSVG